MDDEALRALTNAWIEGDPDPETQAELRDLLAAGALDEVRARMTPPLVFGTAGLRGRVGAGSARMNRATVIRTTRGLAAFLSARGGGARSLPVVVGRDARSSSERFATDVCGVLAAARIPVRYFPDPVPTPLVAYATRALAATAGVVITASHNPRDDNGYKLYLDDAVQLTAPHDAAIERAIEAAGPAASVPRVDFAENAAAPAPWRSELEPLDVNAWFERYLTEALASLGPREGGALRIAYTPLHGVGWRFARRALERAGYTHVRVVPEQAEPDGAFPTTPFPNPEEPETLELALRFAEKEQADVLIANDPDADRLAVAVPTPSGRWLRLSGNQLAALFADARVPPVAAGTPPHALPIVTTSVVTTPLVEAIARSRGARVERTLTGFKWLWTAALALERRGAGHFAYACEEALGYSLTPAVRDKDGIAAAVAFADLAARCRREGRSVLDRLHALAREFGVWASAQHNVAVSGRPVTEATRGVLDRAAAASFTSLGGRAIEQVRDYRRGSAERPAWLSSAPLVEFELAGGRVLLRPSGTEPKLKLYVDLRGEATDGPSLEAVETALAREAAELAHELVEKLGLTAEDARA
ncbi:MAG TPA: phospho-sugar mutase [Polyangiaceae bacterium]|nr:phospho-sugar mutase [Polyangiaceae bacterium]